MKKLRILLCSVLVLASVLALSITGVSAAETGVVDTWDGTATSGWVDKYTNGTYEINSAEDLAAFAKAVSGGKNFAGETVVLNCDIVWAAGDASEWSEITAPKYTWTPVGTASPSRPFSGTFDGQGHTVSGLYTYNKSGTCAGFFNYLLGEATIKNLHVANSYFNAQRYVGSIVASCQKGTSDTSPVTISGCSSDAYIVTNLKEAKDHFVGGIIGAFNGKMPVTIENCAFTGNIVSEYGQNVGGIAGSVNGTSITIKNCLATGTYTGYTRLGGIVGRAYSGLTISNCYVNVKLYTWATDLQGAIIGAFRKTTDSGYMATNNTDKLTISNCYVEGESYHATGETLGKFRTQNIRLGKIEVTNGEALTDSSTYYTDSTTFSTEMGGTKKGGLSAWLALSSVKSVFKQDMYGNVVLSALECAAHDHNVYAGEWFSDSSTGGQKADCLYPGCYETITRKESFELCGLSIKWESTNGIRFLTRVDKNEFFKDLYNGDYKYYNYSGANVTFGTLIVPARHLDGELTIDTDKAVNVEAKKIFYGTVDTTNYTQTDDVFYYTSVLVNFPETILAYSGDIVARSYMTYIDEATGERVYVYTNTMSASFYDMAECFYDSATVEERQGYNKILALGAVDEDFASYETNRVLYLENASKELFDEYAASLASQGYTKHTNYRYSGNSFGMYYNKDYVVTFYYTPKTIKDYYDDVSKITEDMDANAAYAKATDATNVMRVIVEKRSQIDLPGTEAENKYARLDGQKNTIAYAFMNDNYNLSGGMGYIIQLADGSFIIIDGGENKDDPRDGDCKDTDSDHIWQYLDDHKPDGTDKPVIAAWILTHVHTDHVNAMKAFCEEYKNDVVLEQVIYNFKTGDIAAPTVNRDMERFAEYYVKRFFPSVQIHRAHTGYKFYIRNAVVSILFSIDDLDLRDDEGFDTIFENNESLVFDVVIDETQRLMFTGDMFIPASQALTNMYGSNLKTDVLQVAHHASQGATLAVNKLFWPNDGTNYKTDSLKFLLVPNAKNTLARTRLAYQDENYYLLGLLGHKPTSAGSAQNFNLATKKIYVNGDLVFENGLPSGVSNYYKNVDEQNSTAVFRSGAIGRWKTIYLYTYVDTDDKYDNFIDWIPDKWN